MSLLLLVVVGLILILAVVGLWSGSKPLKYVILVLVIAVLVGFLEVRRVDRVYRYSVTCGKAKRLSEMLMAKARVTEQERHIPPVWDSHDQLHGLTNDCWGRSFTTRWYTNGFTIISLGEDGVEGGSGYGQDIIGEWRVGWSNVTIQSAGISP